MGQRIPTQSPLKNLVKNFVIHIPVPLFGPVFSVDRIVELRKPGEAFQAARCRGGQLEIIENIFDGRLDENRTVNGAATWR